MGDAINIHGFPSIWEILKGLLLIPFYLLKILIWDKLFKRKKK